MHSSSDVRSRVGNRICSRAQKGFNSQRYTQECLINVIETIAHCRDNKINGAVVAVDMAKAFDTLSHAFLREVFKFFNIGPVMIKWLTLLGENRTACILLDDGSYSRNFQLGRGRAQGDNISPNTFNFADQILILKIELDPNLNGIWKNFQIPPTFPTNTDSFFMYESGGETAKNESLADDNTTLMLLEEGNLKELRRILDEFGNISGLLCNYDKTVVMPVGENVIPHHALSGFSLSNSVCLLGLEINRDLDNIDDIFIGIGEKVLNLILFWSRFRLSLPGRIAILKTLLIPQLNYLGCILTPGPLVLKNLQEMLDDFAIDGLRISKDRYYTPPSEGGLGLIHLGTFLMAQKCSWVKRTHSNTIDNWRLKLRLCCPNFDVALLRKVDVDPVTNPVIYGIAEAFELFVNCFSSIGLNYKLVPVLNNKTFCRFKDDSALLDIKFFGKNLYNAQKDRIRSLTFEDCFDDGTFKSVEQFEANGLILPISVWMRLRSFILWAKKKFRCLETGEETLPKPQSVNQFLLRFKKGSKYFRNIIDRSVYQNNCPTNLQTLQSFCNIVSVPIPLAPIAKNFLSGWNRHFIDNNLRDFIFRCRNNVLRTGDRLSHILSNYNDTCYLCRNLAVNTVNRETFVHFFRKCHVTSELILRFNKHFKLTWNVVNLNFDKLYWFGDIIGTLDIQTLLLYDIFRYQLWSMRQRKVVDLDLLIVGTVNTLRVVFNLSPVIRTQFLNNNSVANVVQATG